MPIRLFSGSDDMTPVQPLRLRIGAGLAGQHNARTHLDNLLLHGSLERRKLWTVPEQVQIAALGWWLMQLYWEIASTFVESIALECEEGKIPTEAFVVGQRLCDAAEAMSVQAIRGHSQVEVNVSLPPMPLQPFPGLPPSLAVVSGVWAAYEAIYLQVVTDRRRILAEQVPRRFQPVLQALQQVISPSVALHEHYQGQWLVAPTPEQRLHIVRQAQEEVQQLFAAGQKLWAPYLVGSVYLQCLHAKQTLDDLELGFDPWAITDPDVRASRQTDPKSVDALTKFWFDNPSPGKSYRLFQEILAARERQLVRHATRQSFSYCPWAPLWVAWRPVVIGGVALAPGDYFTLYVGRDAEGGFVSEIRKAGELTFVIRPGK